MATVGRRREMPVVLNRFSYKEYVRLTNASKNRHLKMAYHDGILEIVSPRRARHEVPSRWLAILVSVVADHRGLRYHGSRSASFRRSGVGPFSGTGREPDESFYIASVDRIGRNQEINLDAGDLPPDLWIEVDNRFSSAGRLPSYALLGVPEVWRYRSRRKTIEFLGLDGLKYQSIDRSLALPVLTPALVLEALALGDQLFESEWTRLLREWVVRTIPGPADQR